MTKKTKAPAEEIPAGVEITDNSNEAINDIASETSTDNEVPENFEELENNLNEGEQTTEQPNSESSGATNKDGKKIPSAKYYLAFSNGALTGIDRLWEMIMSMVLEPEVNSTGLKNGSPKDFADNVLLLAEQLELTEVQISHLLGWMMVVGVIGSSYAKITAERIKESKKIKEQKATIKQTPKTNILTNEESILRKVETEQREASEGIKKRGNWKYHTQPCDCINCKKHRDIHGNIITDAHVVQ